MGWNTWNKYGCDISEQLIKDTAKQLKATGLTDLGYEYLNVDDCWAKPERAADGHVQIDDKFPSGMKSLGDYLHSLGLKFGIYSSAGTMTCAKRAGSLGYETIDAEDYASWGVDYLKYDNCFNQKVPATERYPAMRDALNSTGRPIFYSICNWGEEATTSWAPKVGNSWRTTQDIADFWTSMEFNFRENMAGRERSGSGGWNDPDMLEVGVGGLTHTEE
jgi:alpha-galactosidase